MNGIDLNSLPEILTAKDIAKYLGTSYNYALSLIKYQLIYIKLGSSYRVTKAHFKEFLDKNVSQEMKLR